MAEDSELERTEPASARKLEKARAEGRVPRSRELATFAVLLAGVGVILLMGVYMLDQLTRVMADGLRFAHDEATAPARMLELLLHSGWQALAVLLPVALAGFAAAVLANLLVSGWVLAPKALAADFSRLDPLKGLARLFSWLALAELVKALLKSGLIAGVAAWVVWLQWEDLLALGAMPLQTALAQFARIILSTLVAAVAAYALVVALDVPFQLWHYQRQMRMTKEEVRQELKETEGDPQIKARIRAVMREQARRRMMAAVPKADVVVVNPLHYAVALEYQERRMSAPRVVAKGAGLVAERIKELARAHRVPIVEAPPLARALYRHAEVGETIPAALFTAVAQVLAYVYRLRQPGPRPLPPTDWQVPADLDPAGWQTQQGG
ncbi:MAG: flagellar biosynthesis protein FlhB [Thiobacillaceae bacterium]|nr:flagellar biosynthesis protein FlhB [Thiobacillaceae bacterium]MDW8323850.1 flagellar biosynthesis protein FlhB [Burkholderiales bacterium]